MAVWKIKYSEYYPGSKPKEYETTLEASTIREVLNKAESKIITPMRVNHKSRVRIKRIELEERK